MLIEGEDRLAADGEHDGARKEWVAGTAAATQASGAAPRDAGRPMRVTAGRSGYGARRTNLPALLLVLALHVAALTALLLYRVAAPRLHAPALKVFDVAELTPPPPAAPPAPPDTQPPVPSIVPPRIVAPPPLVAVPPATPPAVQTVPDPPPPAAVVEAPRPAPAAATRTIAIDDFSISMIAAEPPRYPLESRRKREQGIVALMVLVGIDGRVASVSIQQSSGFSRLDNAALSAVRRWRWSPRKVDGVAVQVRGIVSIPFVLRG